MLRQNHLERLWKEKLNGTKPREQTQGEVAKNSFGNSSQSAYYMCLAQEGGHNREDTIGTAPIDHRWTP